FTLEFGEPTHLPLALCQFVPVAWHDGEVFAVTAEAGLSGYPESWRIVGFPACRADFNGDGVADLADLAAFLEGREQGMMSADYNMNAKLGFPSAWDDEDFLEFMRALEEGC